MAWALLFRMIGPVREFSLFRGRLGTTMGETAHSSALAAAPSVADVPNSASFPLDAASLSAAIVQSCSEAIVPTTLEGIIIGWNFAAAELLGYSAEEAIGQHWRLLVPREQVGPIARAAACIQRGDKHAHINTMLRRKDGTLRDARFMISPLRDASGTLVGFSSIFRDITEERLAEKQRRLNEEKFRTVFKHISDAVSLSDLDGRYIDVNDEFCRMVRKPVEEIIGKTPIELRILRPAQWEALASATDSGGLHNYEFSLMDPDRIPHSLLLSSVPVELDGTPCVLGVVKDITELRRAESDLIRIERQLNEVLANAPLVVLAFNADRIITAARGRALSEMGLEPGDLVGKSIMQLLQPDNPAMQNAERALAGESFSAIETILRGNRVFEVWYSPILDHKQRVTGATAVATDITERQRAEDDLRRSEKYYRSLVESSADLTVVTSEDGIVTFAAGAGRKDFGYEVTDLVGLRAMDFIHPDKHEEQRRLIAECFARPNAIGRGEAPIRCKDGSWLDCELIGRSAIATDGQPILLSTVRNISARKQAELEIEKSRDQALAASRAKSEFLSSMSHEIRTPMNAILGMADLMWESDLNAEQRRYLDTMINNGNALLELINSILDLAKVESGRMSLEALDFDLRELIEKVADTLAVRADERGVELGVRIDHDVPTALVGDPLRLRQVLTNLVGNAIKFTERGAVVIRVRRDLRTARAGSLLISVIDTGIGIPADKLPALFNPFSQADSSITRKYGGTGLGLAIVDRLVRLMGGSVGVESTLGQGSTFSFDVQFQVRDGLMQAGSAEPRETTLDLDGIKVLIVDDNEVNRTIVREMLHPCGATVVEAASGPEGIEQFQRAAESAEPVRVLISDQMMPGMDGFEMVRQIRTMSSAQDLSIMMLSSTDLPQTLTKVRRLGIEWYVVKPVKRGELYEAIAGALAHHAPGQLTAPVSSVASASVAIVPRPLRILLADDSADNRLLIQAYLRKTPYCLEDVDDGEKALERILTRDYDVVLMDIQMPVMDGYTAVEKVREWEARNQRRHLPIIALTASALEDAVRHTREVGFDLHVSKPVKRGTLLNAIAKSYQAVAEKSSLQ
jgi:PAS domain S-box-containing protein